MTTSAALLALSLLLSFFQGDAAVVLRWIVGLFAFGLFLSGAQAAWRKEHADKETAEREVALLKDRLKGKLIISNIAEPMVENSLYWHRILVRNTGGSTAHGVGARIISFDPSPEILRQRGDIPLTPRGRLDRVDYPAVSVHPDGEQAFDFIIHGHGEQFIRLNHNIPTLPRELPLGHYLVHVIAEAVDTPKAEQRFWIRPKGRGITVEPDEC